MVLEVIGIVSDSPADLELKIQNIVLLIKRYNTDLYFELQVKGFETEHLHTDEEIRFILKGSAFFDVRDGRADTWIRIRVSPGDFLILPAGIYHRLTIIEGKSVKLLRLFRDRPIWEAYNRPADHLESRKNYVSHLKV
jgi:1,2-dihydroxy-3-keto-5-methylthiopentene dioxygenase